MSNQRTTERIATVVAGLVLSTVFILMFLSQKQFSPVYDEVANIPTGYNFLTTGRYTDATHPPLARYYLAAPLFILGADPLSQDSTALYRWQDYGAHFLFRNPVPWQQILSSARLMVILLTIGLLAFIWFWIQKQWGGVAALMGLLFLAFEPTVLAHGQLATLDMAFALTFVVATWALWRYVQKPDWRQFWWLQMAFAGCFLTKFAAIPLFGAAIISLFYYNRSKTMHLKRFWWTPVVFAGLIFATYLFQIKSPAQDLQIAKALQQGNALAQMDKKAAELGMSAQQILNLQVPAYDFWKGFGMQVFHAMFQDLWEKKESFQYLNGDYSRRGWRTYFLWTFGYKSTLATLILALLLTAGWVSGRKKAKTTPAPTGTWAIFLAPSLLFLACALGTINIGHRYILPVYPFLALGIGFMWATRTGIWRWAIGLLLCAHVASSLSVWPHHLSYFNEFSRKEYYLADSNIDWGQDLLFLKKDMESTAVQATTVWGDCFGVIKPSHFGLNLRPIPAEGPKALGAGTHTIYLSIHRFLNRSSVNPQGLYPWLNELHPVRKVGTSILVYQVTISE